MHVYTFVWLCTWVLKCVAMQKSETSTGILFTLSLGFRVSVVSFYVLKL